LEINKLLFSKKIAAFFPLHDRHVADALATCASSYSLSPWRFPFRDFRTYFGEKISLYMVFLGHYSKWLLIPSVIGFVFQLVVWGSGDYSSPVLPFFALVITVWAVMFLEFWKREEKTTAMFWGMTDFER
jgi:anoctamin-10